MMWGPTLPELTEALPGVENIERSVVNAWDEPRVHDAVARTGRQKLLIGGITTHVCLAFPAMSAVADGYDVFALLDASGTWPPALSIWKTLWLRPRAPTLAEGAATLVNRARATAQTSPSVVAAASSPIEPFRVEISQAALGAEEEPSHVLQHIDLADPQSSRSLR
jgi:hypothetical protein